MNKVLKVVFINIGCWLLLSAMWLYMSEAITKKLFPGFDSVGLWVEVVVAGLVTIFILMTFLLWLQLSKMRKRSTGSKN